MNNFLRHYLQRCSEIRLTLVSSGLSFMTLLAVVPFLTVVLLVSHLSPYVDALTDAFVVAFNQTAFPTEAADIAVYINRFKHHAEHLGGISLAAFSLIALLFVRTVDNTLCIVWREQQEKRSRRRLLVYPALLVLLPLFIGLISLLRDVLAVQLPELANTLSALLSLLSATLLLWLPYRFVPKRRAPEYCPLLTAFGVALLMKAARYIFTWYSGLVDGYEPIYGATAALLLFMLWLNVMWMLVLCGAVWTAVWSEHSLHYSKHKSDTPESDKKR
ncbi:YihY family inner membrane protein [Neisseria mucosa]|uniref:YihY family inner membrane protein n=1 Tax=Neisseria mucosa TaxID=488 RepID=UPI00280BFE53|nr:YihY family inner membrane protein [Neisseria mucosa]